MRLSRWWDSLSSFHTGREGTVERAQQSGASFTSALDIGLRVNCSHVTGCGRMLFRCLRRVAIWQLSIRKKEFFVEHSLYV